MDITRLSSITRSLSLGACLFLVAMLLSSAAETATFGRATPSKRSILVAMLLSSAAETATFGRATPSKRSILVAMLLSSAAETATQKNSSSGKAKSAAPANTLTPEEKAAGWKLLFDGETTNGWRGFRRDRFPETGWVIEDGAIKHVAGRGQQSQHGGDIITVDQYDNFELQLEWRLSRGGNSGIKYLVAEDMVKSGHSGVGFEMQILDDENHPDAKNGINGNRTAGALYDLIAPQNKKLRPIGEWNHVRLIVNGKHVEHWLNGIKIVEFDIGSDRLKALISASKYKNIPRFGEVTRGHILLQDHGDEVWFRNIKIRELPRP